MTFISLKRLFVGLCLLAPAWLAAQEFDDELQLSSDVVYWYRISNAAAGMDGLAMTDVNGSTASEEYQNIVFMLPTEADDLRSQWKLTAGEEGKVIITNRATGSQIAGTSLWEDDHNITALTTSGATGFTFTSLGEGTYRLESVEDDGVSRCLALADKDGEAIAYPESGESTSAIAWKFFPVEIETGIGSMEAGRQVISVKNGRISVAGSTEWQLFDASGEEMPRTVSLPAGVYLVKIGQKAIKVLMP